jgi:RimJ/RimL family protein N-acetyltransferase
MSDPIIRALTADDAQSWRQLRLEMLERDPQGFFADLDQARARSEEDWRHSIPTSPDVIFGLFDGNELVGSCGFYAEKQPKLAHKGQMWGVYVTPAFRRKGHAFSLVLATIAHARHHVDVLLTGASVAGAPIYKRAGFETYGLERDAYRVDGVSLDNELLAIHFTEN